MARLTLHTLEDTRRLGLLLARAILELRPTPLLLRGGLGSGKTTLVRALVAALPGGGEAEVASPSFTLCHQYPTRPPVLHCDLYRCPGAGPEELLDALDGGSTLVILEWAEHLPQADCPQDYLDFLLEPCDEMRLLTLRACGARATALLQRLESLWAEDGAAPPASAGKPCQ